MNQCLTRKGHTVQILPDRKTIFLLALRSRLTRGSAGHPLVHEPLGTMKQNLWLAIGTCLTRRVNKEFWKTIDYLTERISFSR